jgi:hypothetical protein
MKKRYAFKIYQPDENFTIFNEVPVEVMEKIQDLIGDFMDDISETNHLLFKVATDEELRLAEIEGEKYC